MGCRGDQSVRLNFSGLNRGFENESAGTNSRSLARTRHRGPRSRSRSRSSFLAARPAATWSTTSTLDGPLVGEQHRGVQLPLRDNVGEAERLAPLAGDGLAEVQLEIVAGEGDGRVVRPERDVAPVSL